MKLRKKRNARDEDESRKRGEKKLKGQNYPIHTGGGRQK